MTIARYVLFFAFAALLAALIAISIRHLAPVGQVAWPNGDYLNAHATADRRATDVVTVVNFDVRGFDTLGEEFILFTSVIGVILLLRRHEHLKEATPPDGFSRKIPPTSDAVRTLAVALVGPMALFGFYVATHGQLTPGGGFQGGVLWAAAPLLVYLAGHFEAFQRTVPQPFLSVLEALGAGGYAAIGLLACLKQAPFLTNVLPLGATKDAVSSGTIYAISAVVGIEVGAGFLLLAMAFLEELLGGKEV